MNSRIQICCIATAGLWLCRSVGFNNLERSRSWISISYNSMNFVQLHGFISQSWLYPAICKYLLLVVRSVSSELKLSAGFLLPVDAPSSPSWTNQCWALSWVTAGRKVKFLGTGSLVCLAEFWLSDGILQLNGCPIILLNRSNVRPMPSPKCIWPALNKVSWALL